MGRRQTDRVGKGLGRTHPHRRMGIQDITALQIGIANLLSGLFLADRHGGKDIGDLLAFLCVDLEPAILCHPRHQFPHLPRIFIHQIIEITLEIRRYLYVHGGTDGVVHPLGLVNAAIDETCQDIVSVGGQ